MVEQALEYAQMGFAVFPAYEIREDGWCACGTRDCRDAGKHPRTTHGVKDATTDEEAIRQWWTTWPDANIAIATGSTSGVGVLDIDPRHGGDRALDELEDKHGRLPKTAEARSGSGGPHFYFARPPGLKHLPSASGLGGFRGVDFKGDGGYVIAPFSRHTSGNRYRWIRSRAIHLVEPATIPAWLLDLLVRPSASQPFQMPAAVVEGARNDTLYRLARSLHARGVSDKAILAALKEENDLKCQPPLDEREVEEIAHHAVTQEDREDFRHPSRTKPAGMGGVPVIKNLADVQSSPVHWTWINRIAAGKLNIVMGDPGLGKSMVTLDMAARVTRGADWPDGSPCRPGNVVILTAEDGLADTVRPRIDALSGDPSRITALQAVRENNQERTFNLGRDIGLLEQVVTDTDAVLVIIDPVSAYLGRTDSFKDTEVRAVLAPLAALAERRGPAVVTVMHLTQDTQRAALYRGQGSVGFVAAARSVFAVAKDPNIQMRRFFLPVKLNIAAPPPVLAFRLIDQRVHWESEPVDHVDVEKAVRGQLARDDDEEDAGNEADAFLAELLAEGPVRATEAFKGADAHGISRRTLKRAKRRLGVITTRKGGPGDRGVWYWSLPSTRRGSE